MLHRIARLLNTAALALLVAVGSLLLLGGLAFVWLGALTLLPADWQRAVATVVIAAAAFAAVLSLFDVGTQPPDRR